MVTPIATVMRHAIIMTTVVMTSLRLDVLVSCLRHVFICTFTHIYVCMFRSMKKCVLIIERLDCLNLSKVFKDFRPGCFTANPRK